MDYKKLYEKAVERAKTLTNSGFNDFDFVKHIFPELAESEDEKMRKGIIRNLEYLMDRAEGFVKDELKERIAWLEKQKPIQNINKEDEEVRQYIVRIMKQRDINVPMVQKSLNWLEKQGQTFTKKDVDDAYLKGVCDAKQEIEKQGKQNTADKIEPKFHESDWVIDKQGIVHQISNVIKNVTYNTYGYDIVGGGYFNDNTEGVRLWTIQDAKDGDVLVDENNNIGIYKEIEGICWHSYIYLGCDNRLYGFSIGGSHVQNNTKPATKEQRDILEKTMADAGYTFDFEKKELKKEEVDNLHNYLYGEQKHAWSEEDSPYYDDICEMLINLLHSETADVNKGAVQKDLDWLMSLKPQSTWKPSDEQMEVLWKYAEQNNYDGFILTSLHKQLKKLKE